MPEQKEERMTIFEALDLYLNGIEQQDVLHLYFFLKLKSELEMGTESVVEDHRPSWFSSEVVEMSFPEWQEVIEAFCVDTVTRIERLPNVRVMLDFLTEMLAIDPTYAINPDKSRH